MDQTAPTPKWMLWIGYVISALPAMMLIASGVMKLLGPELVVKEFGRLGYHEESVAFALGIVEIACAIVYLIPRTAVLGAILLTGYLGGAIATHVRIGDQFIPPLILGVVIWLGIWLRDGRLRALMPWRR